MIYLDFNFYIDAIEKFETNIDVLWKIFLTSASAVETVSYSISCTVCQYVCVIDDTREGGSVEKCWRVSLAPDRGMRNIIPQYGTFVLVFVARSIQFIDDIVSYFRDLNSTKSRIIFFYIIKSQFSVTTKYAVIQ